MMSPNNSSGEASTKSPIAIATAAEATHQHSQRPVAAKSQRGLVAQDAGRHREQREDDADGDRSKRNGASILSRDERPERYDPRANAIELETMRAITQHVSHRRAVTEHRTENRAIVLPPAPALPLAWRSTQRS
jgi:hypothetical protein